MRRLACTVLGWWLYSVTLAAQPPTVLCQEPRSMFLAVFGATIVAGGFTILSVRDPQATYPQPTTAQVTSGVAVMSLGVSLIVYGTQRRWVARAVPSPSLSRHSVGVVWRVR